MNIKVSTEMDILINLYNDGKIDKKTLEAKRQELYEKLFDDND